MRFYLLSLSVLFITQCYGLDYCLNVLAPFNRLTICKTNGSVCVNVDEDDNHPHKPDGDKSHERGDKSASNEHDDKSKSHEGEDKSNEKKSNEDKHNDTKEKGDKSKSDKNNDKPKSNENKDGKKSNEDKHNDTKEKGDKSKSDKNNDKPKSNENKDDKKSNEVKDGPKQDKHHHHHRHHKSHSRSTKVSIKYRSVSVRSYSHSQNRTVIVDSKGQTILSLNLKQGLVYIKLGEVRYDPKSGQGNDGKPKSKEDCSDGNAKIYSAALEQENKDPTLTLVTEGRIIVTRVHQQVRYSLRNVRLSCAKLKEVYVISGHCGTSGNHLTVTQEN